MRRIAPIVFAVLAALFVVERGINGGAFASRAPHVVGTHGGTPLGNGAECLHKTEVLQTLARTGAELTPEERPFCTDRPDVTDWVAAAETGGTQHLAFDGEGCLVTWNPAPDATCP